jgi:peptidoglycan/xylan/chitin deacetylase (PgdA/CDA1 family)
VGASSPQIPISQNPHSVLNQTLKKYLQQINFFLGRNPRPEKRKDWRKFVPEPYRSVVIISADFELAWAWRYSKGSTDPLPQSLRKAKTERINVPKILALCDQYNIPVTWLTVGHLFLKSCQRENGKPHPELLRVRNFENDWWRFTGNDWFEYDPCSDFRTDPLWYCPDLVKLILNSKPDHEIGCHTFSHIDCRDNICSHEMFKSEINACFHAARALGIYKMESFVHPGHTIGNLDTLTEMGFTNYRTDYANILGYPKKHENGLWEFTTTLELELKPDWSVSSQINRYIITLKRALRHNTLAYFWFHPSLDPEFVEQIMPAVFKWLDSKREKIWITNTRDYVSWLNHQSKC